MYTYSGCACSSGGAGGGPVGQDAPTADRGSYATMNIPTWWRATGGSQTAGGLPGYWPPHPSYAFGVGHHGSLGIGGKRTRFIKHLYSNRIFLILRYVFYNYSHY
jgi:hypothetical protein